MNLKKPIAIYICSAFTITYFNTAVQRFLDTGMKLSTLLAFGLDDFLGSLFGSLGEGGLLVLPIIIFIVCGTTLSCAFPFIYELVIHIRRVPINARHGYAITLLSLLGGFVMMAGSPVIYKDLIYTIATANYNADINQIYIKLILLCVVVFGVWTVTYVSRGVLVVRRTVSVNGRKSVIGIIFLVLLSLTIPVIFGAILSRNVVTLTSPYRQAQKGADYKSCEEIDDNLSKLKSSCYTRFAVSTKDVGLCRFTSFDPSNCYKEAMKSGSDWRDCALMPNSDLRSVCYGEAARVSPITKDHNMCSLITFNPQTDRLYCYTKLAIVENDPTLCENIPVSGPQIEYSLDAKSRCVEKIELISAVERGDWSMCYEGETSVDFEDFYKCHRYFLPGPSGADICYDIAQKEEPQIQSNLDRKLSVGASCYYYLANYTEDMSWCDYIHDSKERKYCEEKLVSGDLEPLPDYLDSLAGEYIRASLYSLVYR